MEPLITADDVVRTGACVDGVYAAIKKMRYRIAAAMPVSEIVKKLDEREKHYAVNAASLDGNGYGYGDGYGDGYGYGYGYGDGYGYGYGDGNGDGNGDGYVP